MENLIYDRTSSDVDNALNNPNSSTFLKGAYNYTDLNRVEEWCEYLEKQLNLYGAKLDLEIKKDWNINDTLKLRKKQIDRIRNNVKQLKDFCISIGGEILFNNTLDYEQANTLERILYDIYMSLIEMNIQINLNYNIGATLVRKDYFSLKVKTEIIEEILEIESDMKIGATFVKKDFIHLEAKNIPEEYEFIDADMKIGAIIVDKEFIHLVVNGIKENAEIKSNENIGATIVSKDYIKLKEVK